MANRRLQLGQVQSTHCPVWGGVCVQNPVFKGPVSNTDHAYTNTIHSGLNAAAWEPWIVESHAMKLVDNLWQDIANGQML